MANDECLKKSEIQMTKQKYTAFELRHSSFLRNWKLVIRHSIPENNA